MRFISYFIVVFVWVYVTFFLPSFYLIYALRIFFSKLDLFISLSQKIPDFYTLILLALILPGLGIYINIRNQTTKFILPWTLPHKISIINYCISLLFAYVFWHYFNILSTLGYFGFLFLSIIFVFYFPQVNSFLRSQDLNSIKKMFFKDYKSTKFIGLFFTIIVFFNLFIFIFDKGIRKFNNHVVFLSKQPKVKLVKPKIAYYDTKVILLGSNFGWGGTIHTKFYNQYGPINISLWNDTKIIFTIPLHWKLGDIDVWVETDIFWEGKKIHVKSNDVKMKLIDREGGFDEEDEEYFEQLKHLDEETLRINGYTK